MKQRVKALRHKEKGLFFGSRLLSGPSDVIRYGQRQVRRATSAEMWRKRFVSCNVWSGLVKQTTHQLPDYHCGDGAPRQSPWLSTQIPGVGVLVDGGLPLWHSSLLAGDGVSGVFERLWRRRDDRSRRCRRRPLVPAAERQGAAHYARVAAKSRNWSLMSSPSCCTRCIEVDQEASTEDSHHNHHPVSYTHLTLPTKRIV